MQLPCKETCLSTFALIQEKKCRKKHWKASKGRKTTACNKNVSIELTKVSVPTVQPALGVTHYQNLHYFEIFYYITKESMTLSFHKLTDVLMDLNLMAII